jgi:hypothetical protein
VVWTDLNALAGPSCTQIRSEAGLVTTSIKDVICGKVDGGGGKRTFGELKAYLRATDHTSSNIISRDKSMSTFSARGLCPSSRYKAI